MSYTRAALLVASYEYTDLALRQLMSPSKDVKELATILSDQDIGSFDVEIVLNQPSSVVNEAIERFFSGRKPLDLLLLYFSGHGVKSENGLLFLTSPNTRLDLLRATSTPATFVNEVMRESSSRRQILLLDCCYSGAFAKGSVTKAQSIGSSVGTQDQFEGTGRIILTASDSLQFAFEGERIDGNSTETSLFTRAIITGLESGQADLNEDGKVSCDELYEYTRAFVSERQRHQNPRKWGFDLDGTIHLAQYRTPDKVFERLASRLISVTPEIRSFLYGSPLVFIGPRLFMETNPSAKDASALAALRREWGLDAVRHYFSVTEFSQEAPETYDKIAALPVSVYITTAFDQLIVDALRRAGKEPHPICLGLLGDQDGVLRNDKDYLSTPSEAGPLVAFLHGMSAQPGSLVLDEDDRTRMHLMDNRRRILDRYLFESSHLYLGFGLSDDSLAQIRRYLNVKRGNSSRNRFYRLTQIDRSDLLTAFERNRLSNRRRVDADSLFEFIMGLEDELRKYIYLGPCRDLLVELHEHLAFVEKKNKKRPPWPSDFAT